MRQLEFCERENQQARASHQARGKWVIHNYIFPGFQISISAVERLGLRPSSVCTVTTQAHLSSCRSYTASASGTQE